MARQSRDTVSLNTAFKYMMQDIDLKKNYATYLLIKCKLCSISVTYYSGKLKSLFINLDLPHF